MKLDRALYRQASKAQSDWHEAAERARATEVPSPLDAWRQYVDLVQFCWKLCPEQSPYERREKLAALDHYYECVRRMEQWRRRRGTQP